MKKVLMSSVEDTEFKTKKNIEFSSLINFKLFCINVILSKNV